MRERQRGERESKKQRERERERASERESLRERETQATPSSPTYLPAGILKSWMYLPAGPFRLAEDFFFFSPLDPNVPVEPEGPGWPVSR